MILLNSFLAKANEQLYKEVIGFLEVVQIFKIILGQNLKEMQIASKEQPIDTRRFIEKKMFYPQSFFNLASKIN
jgi:hypothetical protein